MTRFASLSLATLALLATAGCGTLGSKVSPEPPESPALATMYAGVLLPMNFAREVAGECRGLSYDAARARKATDAFIAAQAEAGQDTTALRGLVGNIPDDVVRSELRRWRETRGIAARDTAGLCAAAKADPLVGAYLVPGVQA